MKISNKEELFQFLETNCPREGSYAIITYEDGKQESIWFSVFNNWTTDENGVPKNWYLESPNMLFRTELAMPYLDSLKAYANEIYEEVNEDLIKELLSMVRNGCLYEIDSFQCEPFLPDKLDDIKLVSESECLDWMLENNKQL